MAKVDRSVVGFIWSSSTVVPRDESHPARRWFRNRWLWRAELPAPPMLRWRAAGRLHTGAGSIVALLAAPRAWVDAWPGLPPPAAVQVIATDEAGNPALDRPESVGGLGKRTIGSADGAVLVIGNPVLSDANGPVRVAEGIADALALAARYDAPVLATTGTSGLRNSSLAAWLATAPCGVVIHADNDESKKGRAPAGTVAAGFLRRAILDVGGTAEAIYPPACFKDVAEAAGAAGFGALGEGWIDYARTLAEMTDWPRWEVARIAQIVV